MPRSHFGGIQPGELALYTDGACKGNQHVSSGHCPAGWGVAVVVDRALAEDGGRCAAELYGPVELDAASPAFLGAEVGSNNTGELSGVCAALQWLVNDAEARRAPGEPSPAAICYDSEYAANQVQGKWKTNKNFALVAMGKDLLARARATGRKVRFIHVKGHSNHQWNDRADMLANKGAAGQRSSRSGKRAREEGNDETK